MDRATRKANLKKLQLPGTADERTRQQCKTRNQSKTTTETTTTISNYFLPPENQQKSPIKDNIENPPNESKDHDNAIDDNDKAKLPAKPSRLKRIKLDTFVFKDPQNIPTNLKNVNKPLNDEDDLVVPEKKVKKAPKLTCTSSRTQTKRGKSSKTKKQQSIKSAFLRNEQIFAEIAAQHCAADQFDGDDIQLALAISKSEAESNGIQNAADNDSENVVDLVDCKKNPELLIEKLQKYGFKTAEKKDYNTFAAAFLPKANGRKPKSKWANKFTPLTLRNPETQNKKLQDNIKSLLNEQHRFQQMIEDVQLENTSYKLQSSLLKNCDMENQETIIQKVKNTNLASHQYFVVELFEINELPAGHLLKDWSAIQGRDLTPTTKSLQSRERSMKLENIYRELEEFFKCRNNLDLTNETNEDIGILSKSMEATDDTIVNTMVTENHNSNATIPTETNNVIDLKTSNDTPIEEDQNELDEMVALIEEINENDCSVTNSSWEKLKDILPPVKSLDMMNVSVDFKPNEKEENENSIVQNHNTSNIPPPVKSLDTMYISRTEATFHSIQNTRSNSPDLFADSDIEMDDTDSKVVNVVKLDKSDPEDINVVTTYEIYSSDEVKNTSSSEHNDKSSRNGTFIYEQSLVVNAVIDLTQDNLEMPEPQLSATKAIIELDLFDESPIEDINCNSQKSKYLQVTKEDTLKFTLSSQSSTDYEQENTNTKITDTIDDTIELIRKSMKTKQCDIVEDNATDDEDLVLREIGMDQTNSSFLNFEGTKQLETCFHKETAVAATDAFKDSLTANDTIFRELCNKYLVVSEQQTPSGNKTDNYLRRSFTQPLAKSKTSNQLENITDTSLDLTMMNMENIKAARKSNSFNSRTPKKSKNSNEFILSKSQSFNDKSDISIDLTQCDDGDEDDDGVPEDDDDCLILSDDEINYSIWQANKTGNLKTSVMSDKEEDAISIPDNCLNTEEENKDLAEEDVISFPNKYHVEFDYMDLSSSLKAKEPCSNLEIPSTKSKSEEFNFDRLEFGILEELSEPIDYTSSLCTPTKHLNDLSFLNSPTEKTEPMKRYSNCQKSSQKFNDLLKNLDKQSSMHNDFQDFDELDRLVYDSPFNKSNSFKNPEGLEQLLTAELSFTKSPLPKTPTKTNESSSVTQEFNYNSKIYTIRSVTSPKPDYTNISESELLKQLYNFGIKPLKRKQAVKMLEYIYTQTHPILLEDDVSERQQDHVINMDDEPSTSKSCLQSLSHTSYLSQNLVKTKETIQSLVPSQSIDKETIEDVNNKLLLKDACGMEMLRYSIDLKAELFDENYIIQTNVTKKTPQPLLPFHIAWYNLVCSNHKLHETILMYEPLDLQQIYLYLKGLGYRYDPKDLKLFFDRRCIIFRYDLAAAGVKSTDNNRHIRKKLKTKKK